MNKCKAWFNFGAYEDVDGYTVTCQKDENHDGLHKYKSDIISNVNYMGVVRGVYINLKWKLTV